MPKLNWDGNDFRNSQDSSGSVADNISRDGNLQQGYDHGSLTRGLVAYYPMEKGEGEILHDAAFDNIGQIKGANWNGSGEIGSDALSFDGSSEAKRPEAFQTISKNNTHAVSCWIKADEIPGSNINCILINRINNDNRFGLSLDTNNNITAGIYDANQGSYVARKGYSSFSDTSNWHHILWQYNNDTGESEFYFDGTSYNSSGGVASGSDNDTFTIAGPAGSSNNYFSGLVDDVRVYNRALSQPEIEALANLSQPSGVERTENDVPGQSEGGISRYKLDGNTDDAWSDNNGTNNGADLTATGIYGQAAQFVSSENDYIRTDSDFKTPDYITVSSWVYSTSLASNDYGNTIVNHDGRSDDYPWIHRMGSNGFSPSMINEAGNSFQIDNVGNVSTDQWYHGLWTFDGSELRFYLNGDLIASKSASGKLAKDSGTLSIGVKSNNNRYFDGKIDDVRIYNKALTPVQVERLYHKGAYRISRKSTLQ